MQTEAVLFQLDFCIIVSASTTMLGHTCQAPNKLCKKCAKLLSFNLSPTLKLCPLVFDMSNFVKIGYQIYASDNFVNFYQITLNL